MGDGGKKVIHEVEKKWENSTRRPTVMRGRSRPARSTDGTGRRGTPTEQADQRGEVKKKCEVEKNRPVGQCQKSLGHGLVVAASAVEG